MAEPRLQQLPWRHAAVKPAVHDVEIGIPAIVIELRHCRLDQGERAAECRDRCQHRQGIHDAPQCEDIHAKVAADKQQRTGRMMCANDCDTSGQHQRPQDELEVDRQIGVDGCDSRELGRARNREPDHPIGRGNRQPAMSTKCGLDFQSRAEPCRSELRHTLDQADGLAPSAERLTSFQFLSCGLVLPYGWSGIGCVLRHCDRRIPKTAHRGDKIHCLHLLRIFGDIA